MKATHLLPLLFLTGAPILWGQVDQNGTTPPVLPPLAVEASSAGDLALDDALIIDASALSSRSLVSLDGISAIAPNLHMNGNGIKSFGDVITLRGVGNTQFFGGAGVQMYVDGVPQGNVFSYGSALYDLESIEVLRGPQGHRFGKVSSGGAINLRTQRPGDAQKSKATVSFGSFSSESYQFSSSGPLQDNLSYVLALRKAQSDGFLENTSGRDNDSESLNGRLSFLWDGGEGTKASFGLSFDDHELGAQPVVSRNQANFYARSTEHDEFTEIDRNQQYLIIERELDEYQLISITSRNDWSMDPNRLDLDLNIPGNTFFTATSLIEQEQNEWSQEIRLEAEEGSSLDWSLGFFYADSEVEGKATRDLTFMGDIQTTTYNLDSENHALFASVGKNLTEVDKLTVGLRFDKFDKSLKRSKVTVFPASEVPHSGSEDFSSLSPSIEWKRTLSDQLIGVARFSYVEKPGGYSAFTDKTAELKFSEEEMNAYEIGFQYKPSDDWGLNVSAYLNDIDNYQFELPSLPFDYYVANADEVTAKGLEIEGYFVPAPNWTLSAMYGLCDTEYDEFASLATLKGKQVSFVPDHTLSLSLSYADEDGLFGQLGSRTIGETHYWDNTGINSGDVIDTYTLLDARIGIQQQDWEISVFATNLTDEEYHTSLVSSLINPLDPNLQKAPGVVGSPRVVGFSVSREF